MQHQLSIYQALELTLEESKQLNLDLEHSFVNKNENIKEFLAATFESLPSYVKDTKDFIQKVNQIERQFT